MFWVGFFYVVYLKLIKGNLRMQEDMYMVSTSGNKVLKLTLLACSISKQLRAVRIYFYRYEQGQSQSCNFALPPI